jgi:hypothetical protein
MAAAHMTSGNRMGQTSCEIQSVSRFFHAPAPAQLTPVAHDRKR